ncbi:MAG TPA: trypsin-like serine peptidase [Arsenophonus nasoniae]|uniref:trypsin-like serine peptidase n=1 Tax=Arsenophonus nasoniae TaxID=638 RepID=UPI003879992F
MNIKKYADNSKIIHVNHNFMQDNQSSLIRTFVIEEVNVQFIRLVFSLANMPSGSYIEITDRKRQHTRIFPLNNGATLDVTFYNNCIDIKVILPKNYHYNKNQIAELTYYEALPQDLTQIVEDSHDGRQPYMWYKNTPFFNPVRAVHFAAFNGYGGSCSFIGSANHVLTNRHVALGANSQIDPEAIKSSEMWVNWHNITNDFSSPITDIIHFDIDKVLTYGKEIGGVEDYALFTITDFDYQNAHVKTLFGGLKLQETINNERENIYIPQHGGAKPLQISARLVSSMHPFASITPQPEYGDLFILGDMEPGSSGSPLIGRETHNILGILWGRFLFTQHGISSPYLIDKLKDFISDSNIHIKAQDNIVSHNIEATPVDNAEIKVILGDKEQLIPFDTILVENHDGYSIVEMAGLDLTTRKTMPVKYKVLAIMSNHQVSHLNDPALIGEVTLRFIPYQHPQDTVIKSWFVARIERDGEIVNNYITRILSYNYDVFEIPFDVNNADCMPLIFDAKQANTILHPFTETNPNLSFYTLRHGQGPENVGEISDGYSILKTQVINAKGEKELVTFQAYRIKSVTASEPYPLISTPSRINVKCNYDFKGPSYLRVCYYPEDNLHLIGKGTFKGIIALHGSDESGSTDRLCKNILLDITING